MSTLTPVGNLAVQSATPYPAMDEEGVGSCEKSWNNSLQNTSDILLTPYADSFSGQLAEKVDFGPAKEEMIQLSGRPDSRELPHGGIAGHDGIWTEGYWWNTGDLTPADFYPTLENFSNNSNGKEADDEGLSCHSFGQSSKGRLVNSIAGSSYTEYDYDIVEESNMRGLQSSEMGYLDFPRYESSRRDMATSKSQFSPDSKSFLKDVLFFGDDSNFNYPTHSHSQGHGIYFTNASLARSETTAHVEMSRQITLCRDSQNGEEYYVIPNDKCNNNNNADYGEGDGDTLENWYTGSLKNEEEFKPVFEKEFNTTPVIWPLNQTKVRDTTPNYFYQGSSNIKPYVSEEDCDYACEQKVKQPERPLSPKPALLFKVGGIVIRNNVQDDADYAKNINMDLQEEPKPYVRYDIGEHNRNDAADGGTSYEKNIVYDDFTTSRPWEEDDRAPWRITRGQNCGFNMEKSLEGAYDIKKPDKKLSKENGRSWGGLVNSNINAPGKTQGDRTSDSGVVKYLGSYVTRWF